MLKVKTKLNHYNPTIKSTELSRIHIIMFSRLIENRWRVKRESIQTVSDRLRLKPDYEM